MLEKVDMGILIHQLGYDGTAVGSEKKRYRGAEPILCRFRNSGIPGSVFHYHDATGRNGHGQGCRPDKCP